MIVGNKICGYAIVCNKIDIHKHVIIRDAEIMSNNIKMIRGQTNEIDLPMKYNHKQNIGTWKKYLLTSYGLLLYGEINKSAYSNEILKMIVKNKFFLSVGFFINRAKETKLLDYDQIKIIYDLHLKEASLTLTPANNLCGCSYLYGIHSLP
jgi:hypothetical protein